MAVIIPHEIKFTRNSQKQLVCAVFIADVGNSDADVDATATAMKRLWPSAIVRVYEAQEPWVRRLERA